MSSRSHAVSTIVDIVRTLAGGRHALVLGRQADHDEAMILIIAVTITVTL